MVIEIFKGLLFLFLFLVATYILVLGIVFLGFLIKYTIQKYKESNQIKNKNNKNQNINIKGEKTMSQCKCNQENKHTIRVKYRDKTLPKLQNIAGIKSDWIDLYASQDYELKQGEFKLIDLNVVVEIPKGYEGHIAPRSSTFKNFGIIQTNSVGVVDNSYCGDEDYLKMPVLAMRDTIINKGDRICQFRIFKKMEETIFEEVEVMDNENRGGIGSTGIN